MFYCVMIIKIASLYYIVLLKCPHTILFATMRNEKRPQCLFSTKLLNI